MSGPPAPGGVAGGVASGVAAGAGVAFAPGRRLGGRVSLRRLLGTGSVAEVWEGSLVGRTRPVAVKILRSWLLHDREVLERFRREGTIARRLFSPHVCQFLEIVENEAGPEGLIFDYEPGETLQQRMSGGGLPLEQVFGLVDQLLQCLETTHAVGIVHRDIKPSNLYLVEGDELRLLVLDFGIAKLIRSGLESSNVRPLTEREGSLGSAIHMAPEQVSSADTVDARADLYAVVSVLFQLLVGAPPFFHGSPLVLAAWKQHEDAPTLARASNGAGRVWPSAAEAFFARGLSRDPAARWQTARELRAALAALAGELRTHAPPISYLAAGDPTVRQGY